jgi:universal stress protein A
MPDFSIHSLGATETPPPSAGFPLEVRQILAPTDLSEDSLKGLNYAVKLARHFGSKLTICHIMEDAPAVDYALSGAYFEEREAWQAEEQARLEQLCGAVTAEHPATEACFRSGTLTEEIVAVAKEIAADLIVISTHDHPWFVRLLTGSDAERILRQARCPVLIVHQQEHDFIPDKSRSF